MKIREETLSDSESIWNINTEAFETEAEAKLVNFLRDSHCTFISFVAETNNEIVGHILLTPVELTGNENNLKLLGLAPMAVLEKHQNKGIGSKLITRVIEHCKSKGYDAIVVLGHPSYYPKFGFAPSVTYSIKSEYEVPDEAFMILELVPNSLKDKQGVIKYHDLFNSV